MSENLDQIVQGKAQKWLDGNYDSKTKDQVKYLMENDKKELTESFYKDLEFGTGGLRGIMGVGTNRMNVYTVGMATQGLANYLKKAFPHEHIKVSGTTAATTAGSFPNRSHRFSQPTDSRYTCSIRYVRPRNSVSRSGGWDARAG